MGLFDKKYCSICGEKIGLLGNRKLEDGNCCKSCAAKLSPFFTERKQSTVEEIKAQLEYREANKQEVAAFNITQTYGTNTKIMVDENQGKFMVSSAKNLADANPDVISISSITNCRSDITQSRYEITGDGPDGRSVSYSPAQYGIDYDFNIIIEVNSPYFNEIRVKLNTNDVKVEPTFTVAAGGMRPPMGGPRPGQGRPQQGGSNPPAPMPIPVSSSTPGDPNSNAEYVQFKQMAEDVITALSSMRQGAREAQAAASAPKTPVICPSCGAQTLPDASGCCEFCGAKVC